MLGDEEPEVRSFADYVLVQTTNSERGVPVLIDLLEHSVSTECCGDCNKALSEGVDCEASVRVLILENLWCVVDRDGSATQHSLPVVTKMLDQRCPRVQEAAQDLLQKLDSTRRTMNN